MLQNNHFCLHMIPQPDALCNVSASASAVSMQSTDSQKNGKAHMHKVCNPGEFSIHIDFAYTAHCAGHHAAFILCLHATYT